MSSSISFPEWSLDPKKIRQENPGYTNMLWASSEVCCFLCDLPKSIPRDHRRTLSGIQKNVRSFWWRRSQDWRDPESAEFLSIDLASVHFHFLSERGMISILRKVVYSFFPRERPRRIGQRWSCECTWRDILSPLCQSFASRIWNTPCLSKGKGISRISISGESV